MRLLLAVLALAGCGSDFAPPAPPDGSIAIDLAVAIANPAPDAGCANTACGGCSSWLNWDGTPSKLGDPCAWQGTWACNGTALVCADLSCPPGAKTSGSVCGADGHTILELTYLGATCSVYDFHSAIAVCNRGAGDHCIGGCAGGTTCAAHCASEVDGG